MLQLILPLWHFCLCVHWIIRCCSSPAWTHTAQMKSLRKQELYYSMLALEKHATRCLHAHTFDVEHRVGVATTQPRLCFPGDDWHHGECNCVSHRDLPGLLSERLARQSAWVMTAHLAAYHKQSTRPFETNGATTVNSHRWLGDRHLSHI